MTRLSVFHVLSREQQDVAALNGHLDAAKAWLLLRHMVPAATVDHVLVRGPQPMIEELVEALPCAGLPPGNAHVETFLPPVPRTPTPCTDADHGRAARDRNGDQRGVRSEILIAADEIDHRRGDPPAQPAVFLPGRHVLHLPGPPGGGAGAGDGRHLLAGCSQRGFGGRVRADLASRGRCWIGCW